MMLFYTFDNCESPDLGEWVSVVSSARVGISDKCHRPEPVNCQIMRRTHASLSRKAGIDPKLVADQLDHGLGVNLDVYTISDLTQRLESVNLLEQSLASTSVNW